MRFHKIMTTYIMHSEPIRGGLRLQRSKLIGIAFLVKIVHASRRLVYETPADMVEDTFSITNKTATICIGAFTNVVRLEL